MDDINELKDQRSHLLRTNQDIVDRADKEGRPIDDNEQRLFNENEHQSDVLKKKIEEIERHNEFKKRAAVALDETTKPAPVPKQKGTSLNSDDDRIPEICMYRAGNLKAFKRDYDAYKSGQWIRATLYGDKRAQAWCREHGVTAEMDRKASNLRSHAEGTNAAGGVLVPDAFEQTVIDLRETYGVFRRNCKVYPMGSDVLNIARRASGLTASFVEEETALTESSKTWNPVKLVAKKLGVLAYYSTELSEDAYISIADDLAQESAYAFALKEDQCGFIGTGTSTYGGITGVNAKLEDTTGGQLAGAIDAGSGIDSLGEVTAAVLAKLIAALPQYAQAGAKFYCSQAAFSLIFERLAVSAGGNTMAIINGSYTPSYLGHPIEISQTLFSNSGATAGNNKIMLMYGNLMLAAAMGDRRGIRYGQSEHIKFVEDQIAIKATERFDINVHDVGDTTTAGPIVGLMGET